MRNDPTELRLNGKRPARSRRHEAVNQARRLLAESNHTQLHLAEDAGGAIDEAFAELPEEAPAEQPAVEALDAGMMRQLTRQLELLDQQREQLAALLSRSQD